MVNKPPKRERERERIKFIFLINKCFHEAEICRYFKFNLEASIPFLFLEREDNKHESSRSKKGETTVYHMNIRKKYKLSSQVHGSANKLYI